MKKNHLGKKTWFCGSIKISYSILPSVSVSVLISFFLSFVYSTSAVSLLLSTKARSTLALGFFSLSFLTQPVAVLRADLLIKFMTGPGTAPLSLTSAA